MEEIPSFISIKLIFESGIGNVFSSRAKSFLKNQFRFVIFALKKVILLRFNGHIEGIAKLAKALECQLKDLMPDV